MLLLDVFERLLSRALVRVVFDADGEPRYVLETIERSRPSSSRRTAGFGNAPIACRRSSRLPERAALDWMPLGHA
jgi:hypothetical protein